jgi:hypothetical protein
MLAMLDDITRCNNVRNVAGDVAEVFIKTKEKEKRERSFD